jgi:tetratricopeptide (TPR) repeat protein
MATLFTLLMWLSVLRGLKYNSATWFWASVIFYALALLSKEHAIMAPAVSVAIALLWWRTKSVGSIKPPLVKHLISVLISYALIGIYTILLLKGVIGKTYEIQGADMASQLQLINQGSIYQFSILNQAALFFKYMALWLVPNPLWMSIDIRVPFVTTFFTWPQTLGLVAFVLYPIVGSALLWRGGRLGILGFALLAPWLMYATEISTVRIQEPFVLYRSYLWFAPAFASFAIIFDQLHKRKTVIILISISLLLYPLAFDRLRTFSHPFMLWDDAARLMDGKSGLPGLERIYVKYGNQLRKAGLPELAIVEQTKAINVRNDFIYSYNERGLAFLDLKQYQNALNDFNKTISIIYNNGKPYPGQQQAVKILAEAYMGRGTSLEFLNHKALGIQSIDSACNLGLQEACTKKTKILP